MSSRPSSHASRSSHRKATKSTSNSTPKASKTEGDRPRSSAYDADFEQHLIDHGIYPEGYEYPDDGQTPEPSNLEEIRQRLAQRRPSLSPSRFPDSAFRDFKRANARVIKEGDVMRAVLPTLYGDTNIPNQQDLLFTRLESITDKATVYAKPDFYDGARLESIYKEVQEDLGPYIIPTGHRTAPAAPNFFLEAKAPKGGADVVKRQVTHDLSLGARGIHQLQSYGADNPVVDNNAYTLGATYHDGHLNMYANHVTLSGPGGALEYHMTQVGGWSTTGDSDTCRRGAAALRHARKLTMGWRNEFISAANEATHSNAVPAILESCVHNAVSKTADAQPVESQTSIDELAVTTLPPVDESDYSDLTTIVEDSVNSVDKLASDTPVNPTPSCFQSSASSYRHISQIRRSKR
jgi:hypothetical protein